MASLLTESEATVNKIVARLNNPDYDVREAVRDLPDDDLLAVISEFFKARKKRDRSRRKQSQSSDPAT